MDLNILYPNRKTCDMMCVSSKVVSYIVTISTNMLKPNPIKSICQNLGIPNQQTKRC